MPNTPESQWAEEALTFTTEVYPIPNIDLLTQQENNTMTQRTSMIQEEFVLPDRKLIVDSFRNCDYNPTFFSSTLSTNFLSQSAYFDEIAAILNRNMNWRESPQGERYWSNVNSQLRFMSSFLKHSHNHSIDPDRFNESNDPTNT